MKMGDRKIIFLCLVASVLIGLLVYIIFHKRIGHPEPPPIVVHTSSLVSQKFFDQAYIQADPYETNESAVAIIVSHHLLVAPMIATTFESVHSQKIRRVIIVGPDHFNRGRTPITTSLAAWRTPYGIIAPDTSTIKAIERFSAVRVDENPFVTENSITALVPFVKRSLPDAEIVPIILRSNTKDDTLRELAVALPVSDDTLFVASVDFSHYLPSSIAAFHDATSLAVLRASAFDDFSKLEVDSIPSLRLLALYTSRRGAQHFELIRRTDGVEATKATNMASVTSYVFARFTHGEPINDVTVTYAAMGSKTFPPSPEGRLAQGFDLSDQSPDGLYNIRGTIVAVLTNPSERQLRETKISANRIIVRGSAITLATGDVFIMSSGAISASRRWPFPVGLVLDTNGVTGFDMRLQ